METINITSQKRRFKVHDNIIFHLIKSQSDSVSWALKELIQNSFDAGASFCEIRFDKTGFSCEDNGRGFNGISEIEEFFETFGSPHSVENNEHFARFRMGRGQIMSFASTCWHSNEFTMNVCIQSKGLTYELKENKENHFNGCRIEGIWYDVNRDFEEDPFCLDDDFISSITKYLEKFCEYMLFFDVYVNDVRVNRKLKECKVILETGNMYYIKSDSPLRIFNLGVFVCDYFNLRLHGVVVTKKNLRLNISRDRILSGCPVWTSIKAKLSPYQSKKRIVMKEDDVSEVLYKIFTDELNVIDYERVKLFYDYNHTRRYSFRELGRLNKPYVLAPKERSLVTDKIHASGMAVILSTKCFGIINPEKNNAAVMFFETVALRLKSKEKDDENLSYEERLLNDKFNYIKNICEGLDDYIKFTESFLEHKQVILDEDLQPREMASLKAIRSAFFNLESVLNFALIGERPIVDYDNSWSFSGMSKSNRNIFAGSSVDANGWTDGESYIVLERRMLLLLDKGFVGADAIATVLLHELCHNTDDEDLLEHSGVFYKTYHQLVCNTGVVARLSIKMLYFYAKYLETMKLKSHKKSRLQRLYEEQLQSIVVEEDLILNISEIVPYEIDENIFKEDEDLP